VPPAESEIIRVEIEGEGSGDDEKPEKIDWIFNEQVKSKK
jgi:hypothetical protein